VYNAFVHAAVLRCFLSAVLVLLIVGLNGCNTISAKPDFVMEMNGFCPDDASRTRIHTRITDGLSKIDDPDLKNFLSTAQIEDNIANDLGKCPNAVCSCPANNFVLGVWRNDFVKKDERVKALSGVTNFVPAGQTFAVRIEGTFLRDAIEFKWQSIPKRYSGSSRKPDPNGEIELKDYAVDYPGTNQMRLTVNGIYHKANDPAFSLKATDQVSLTSVQVSGVGQVHSVACTTDRKADADTSIIEGLSWFLVPFALERAANGSQLEDILGITKALSDARETVPMGAACAAATTLPSEIPLPKLSPSASTALKVDFDYSPPSLTQDALFASGNLLTGPREPSVAVGIPNGKTGITAPAPWFDIFVRSDQFAARLAKAPVRAVAKDMRDPVFTWSVLPTTWAGGPTAPSTGADQTLMLPIGPNASPGDVGYAAVWVSATDADGFVAKANIAVRIRIATCCDTDMFNANFNQTCARRVGVNREKCGNTPSFPEP
jgi:hypothetical protein